MFNPQAHAGAEAPRLNVLVVDDDEAMRSLLRVHLSNAGYSVTVAPDAVAADRSIPHIPIIFITADENFGPRAESLGADFIVKPFLKPRLMESVARNIGAPTRHKRPSAAPALAVMAGAGTTGSAHAG